MDCAALVAALATICCRFSGSLTVVSGSPSELSKKPFSLTGVGGKRGKQKGQGQFSLLHHTPEGRDGRGVILKGRRCSENATRLCLKQRVQLVTKSVGHQRIRGTMRADTHSMNHIQNLLQRMHSALKECKIMHKPVLIRSTQSKVRKLRGKPYQASRLNVHLRSDHVGDKVLPFQRKVSV